MPEESLVLLGIAVLLFAVAGERVISARRSWSRFCRQCGARLGRLPIGRMGLCPRCGRDPTRS